MGRVSAVAGRCRGVVLSFVYWSVRRLLQLVVLRFRSEREKEINGALDQAAQVRSVAVQVAENEQPAHVPSLPARASSGPSR
jgi:hypothetical protein